jgi:hypothetical protein
MGRKVHMIVMAFVSAVAVIAGGNALAATVYPTTFDADPQYDGTSWFGGISSELVKCEKTRDVVVFQKKLDGTKRILGTGQTDLESNFNFVKERDPKKEFGDVYIKVNEREFGDPVGSKVCELAKTTNWTYVT